MKISGSLQKRMQVALETRDTGRVTRLCGQFDDNSVMAIDGCSCCCKEQTLAHHVAGKALSPQCLKAIIDKLGPGCLTCRNTDGNTPVHCAALHQDGTWMQLILDTLGKNSLSEMGGQQRTVAHYAAMNARSNASLKFVVDQCGVDCLKAVDENGNTPVHLAALNQSDDSLQFIADRIGMEVFALKTRTGCTVTHLAAQNAKSSSAFAWCVQNLQMTCLINKDSRGRTPAHLAAQNQDLRSLRLIADRLGMSGMELKDAEGKSVADYAAMNEKRRNTMRNFIIKLQTTVLQLQQQQKPANSQHQDFSWNFMLDNRGKRLLIGKGGCGKVYKAFTSGFQTVAVKIVKPKSNSSSSCQDAIQVEKRGIKILEGIRHPNVVNFLKSESPAGKTFYIITEMVSGHSLRELMTQRQRKPFDESGVREFSRQICTALNFLHSRTPAVLHRDIKCSNIMLSNEGVVKLIDFGLAREILANRTGVSTMKPRGTWHFFAPELLAGEDKIEYTPKTDVWAFGCTVFEMLVMKPPNSHLTKWQLPHALSKRDLPDLPAETSPSLIDFYRRCVVRDPGQRADTAELLRHRFLLRQ